MFRIISAGIGSISGDKRPSGVFGSPKALHRTPRRYKQYENALKKSLTLHGVHTIMDDSRNRCAVVANGKVLAVADGYSHDSTENLIKKMLRK
jgi:hypothetical protein